MLALPVTLVTTHTSLGPCTSPASGHDPSNGSQGVRRVPEMVLSVATYMMQVACALRRGEAFLREM